MNPRIVGTVSLSPFLQEMLVATGDVFRNDRAISSRNTIVAAAVWDREKRLFAVAGNRRLDELGDPLTKKCAEDRALERAVFADEDNFTIGGVIVLRWRIDQAPITEDFPVCPRCSDDLYSRTVSDGERRRYDDERISQLMKERADEVFVWMGRFDPDHPLSCEKLEMHSLPEFPGVNPHHPQAHTENCIDLRDVDLSVSEPGLTRGLPTPKHVVGGD